MKKKTRTETTIESHEIWVLRKSRHAPSVFCLICEDRFPMVKPDAAARLSRTDIRTIYRRMEDGTVHFRQAGNAEVLVCLASLLADQNEAGLASSAIEPNQL